METATSLATATHEIASTCLCRRGRALSRRITNLYEDALRGTGITANQLTVLVAVERAEEIAPGELGELLGMDKSTVSRTVARMIDRGWIRARPAGDRRRALSATADGRECIREAHPRWKRVQGHAREVLGKELTDALLSTDSF